jgi:hypothetical protein
MAHPALIPLNERQSLTTGEQIERLSGFSLDRCEEILTQPLELVLTQPQAAIILNAQVQCIRAIFHTMVKAGLQNNRLERERDRILGEMAAREFGSREKKSDE